MKHFDSLYTKNMFINTYYGYDSVAADFDKTNVTRYYMYDHVNGVRNIQEIGTKAGNDSIEETAGFFLNQKVFKIYTISYPRDSVGKRTPFGKCLYYFDGDSITYKNEDKLSIAPFAYKLHFETLAKNFTIKK
jgi:hypothetical protein